MIIFASDFHIPYEHSRATNAFKKVVHTLRNNLSEIILGGDILDFYALSKFIKTKDVDLQSDLDKTIDFITEIRELTPSVKITLLAGNHEKRLEKYLASKSPEIKKLKCLTLPSLLSLDKNKINFNGKGYVQRGDYIFTHGATANESGTTLKAEYDSWRHPIVMGHSHRQAMFCFTTLGEQHRCYEAGCMQDPELQDYTENPNWQIGFAICHLTKNGKVLVDFATYIDSTLYVRGTRI